MPTFDYVCLECAERFDKLLKKLGERVKCPKCGSKDVHRKFPKPYVDPNGFLFEREGQ